MENTLLQDGFQLMLFGMGTVFVFLVVLIGATTAMSALVQRFFPEAPPVPVQNRAPAQAPKAVTDSQLTAVISTAVHKFRARQK